MFRTKLRINSYQGLFNICYLGLFSYKKLKMFLKIILIIISFVCFRSAYSDNLELKDQILQLDTKNFKKKITIIEKIALVVA